MNKPDTASKPTEIAENVTEEVDEPLVVDDEEAEETKQIKAELREREGKHAHEGT